MISIMYSNLYAFNIWNVNIVTVFSYIELIYKTVNKVAYLYGNIIKDSGKQIHYVELDEDMYSSSDSFEYYADLIENEKYYI